MIQILRKIFELSCLRGARAIARDENSRRTSEDATRAGMAKTIYEWENCLAGSIGESSVTISTYMRVIITIFDILLVFSSVTNTTQQEVILLPFTFKKLLYT